MLDSVLEALL